LLLEMVTTRITPAKTLSTFQNHQYSQLKEPVLQLDKESSQNNKE